MQWAQNEETHKITKKEAEIYIICKKFFYPDQNYFVAIKFL